MMQQSFVGPSSKNPGYQHQSYCIHKIRERNWILLASLGEEINGVFYFKGLVPSYRTVSPWAFRSFQKLNAVHILHFHHSVKFYHSGQDPNCRKTIHNLYQLIPTYSLIICCT